MNGYNNPETYFCSLWIDADDTTRREYIAMAIDFRALALEFIEEARE